MDRWLPPNWFCVKVGRPIPASLLKNVLAFSSRFRIFVEFTVQLIAPRLGREVHDASREAAPFWTEIVCLDLELLDGTLGRDQTRQIEIPGVERSAVR